jgi:drug/metabolite transporter (DMT)-like permease
MSTRAPPSLRRGAAWMLAAAASFAGMGVFVKTAAADDVSAGQVVFWRSVASGALVPLLAWRSGDSLRPVNTKMHVVRGLVGVGSMLCYFTAIQRLPYLGDAVLVTYLSPLLVAGIARPVLGERPAGAVWGALLLGLAGVGLVVGTSGSFERWGTLAAMSSACLAACAYVTVSVLTRTDSTPSVVFWFAVIGALTMSPTLAAGVPLAAAPDLLAIGVLGTAGQWSLTAAYGSAEASRVSVFAYATPIFAYLFALLSLGEVPPLRSILGVLVVVVAGIIAAKAGR